MVHHPDQGEKMVAPQLNRMWSAARALACRDEPLRQRLDVAVAEFEDAFRDPQDWPSELRGKARALRDELDKTDIQQIDGDAAAELAGAILDLAADVHALMLRENEEWIKREKANVPR